MSIQEVSPASTPEVDDENSFPGKMDAGNEVLVGNDDSERAIDLFLAALSYAENEDQKHWALLGLARALMANGRLLEAEDMALDVKNYFYSSNNEEKHEDTENLLRHIALDAQQMPASDSDAKQV